jgi:hypothetical protein
MGEDASCSPVSQKLIGVWKHYKAKNCSIGITRHLPSKIQKKISSKWTLRPLRQYPYRHLCYQSRHSISKLPTRR